MSSIYCTYLTIYLGSKLPPFYIGSSSLKRIQAGYKGSVKSKLYKNIWKEELKNNPSLFKTKIISLHDTNASAKRKELEFHKKLNVVKSTMYINMSIASPNGFFGMNVDGVNNPFYGKKHTNDQRGKWSVSRKGVEPWNKNKTSVYSQETLHKMKRPKTEEHKNSLKKSKKDTSKMGKYTRSKEHIESLSSFVKNKPKIICPHCNKTVDYLNAKRWHLNNCKFYVTD